jgi:hypothetical protein
MPVYVDVWVNDRAVKTYAIGRISGGTDADDMNVYAVMQLDKIDRPLGWDTSIQFEHRYGDGIDVCIRKGLAALDSRSSQTCEHAHLSTVARLIDMGVPCPKCGEKR